MLSELGLTGLGSSPDSDAIVDPAGLVSSSTCLHYEHDLRPLNLCVIQCTEHLTLVWSMFAVQA